MQQEEEIKYKGLFAQYNDGKEFVHNVRNIAPLFNPLDFRYIFKVAYPIAILEVDAMERTKEDFPLVEKTILKMYRNHVSNPRIISKALGLTESYVCKVIRLLEAYGHIAYNQLTELGRESLEQNSSIKMNEEKRKIQVDAITGDPIGIKELVSEQILSNVSESGFRVPHLKPLLGIDKSRLESIVKEQYTNYIDKGDYSLHTNVESINDVKYVELKYAKAFYMEDENGNFFVMCKAFDSTAKDSKERFRWRVLYSSEPSLVTRYGMHDHTILNRSFNEDAFNSMRKLLRKERIVAPVDVKTVMGQLYEFNWQDTEVERLDRHTVKVTKDSFLKYDRFVLKCIESIAEDGYDLAILDCMKGYLILIKTEDEILQNIAKRLKEVISHKGRSYVISSMEKLFSEGQTNVMSMLRKVISFDNNKP